MYALASMAASANTSAPPSHTRIVSSAASVSNTLAKIHVPISTPGIDPTDNHQTIRQ